ncbi:hypothetical protein IMZ48_01600 [Candidatus Bathyarchaeota archaeon]|nr:hypothetical protein [Candidatus Bathyarchaeota archaeon]
MLSSSWGGRGESADVMDIDKDGEDRGYDIIQHMTARKVSVSRLDTDIDVGG